MGALLMGSVALSSMIAIAANGISTTSAWMRPAPTGISISAAYLVIGNDGKIGDRLMRVEADFAEKVEVHSMSMDGEVMKMRLVTDGIGIPAENSVELEPGGYHIMLMQIKEPVLSGQKRIIRFVFEKAAEVAVEFTAGHSPAAG